MKSQKNNMWMKILSVVIAILIWLFVANTNDPVITKRFYSIPVKVTNEDALTKRGYAYEILDGEEVNITVKGKSSIVRSMNISDFQAVAWRKNVEFDIDNEFFSRYPKGELI